MKKLTSKQERKVKALNNVYQMDQMESRVDSKAKEVFRRPPYGGRK